MKNKSEIGVKYRPFTDEELKNILEFAKATNSRLKPEVINSNNFKRKIRKIYDLEKRVNYIDWKQFLPIYGFYQASKDVLKDKPSVLREFAGLSPTKYFGWLAYQAASTFMAIGITHDYLIR